MCTLKAGLALVEQTGYLSRGKFVFSIPAFHLPFTVLLVNVNKKKSPFRKHILNSLKSWNLLETKMQTASTLGHYFPMVSAFLSFSCSCYSAPFSSTSPPCFLWSGVSVVPEYKVLTVSPQNWLDSGPILFPIHLQMLISPLWVEYEKAASLLYCHLTITCLISI